LECPNPKRVLKPLKRVGKYPKEGIFKVI